MRLRLEDLTEDGEVALLSVFEFLKLDCGDRKRVRPFPSLYGGRGRGETDAEPLPAELMPSQLLSRVNKLHRSLGYRLIAGDSR